MPVDAIFSRLNNRSGAFDRSEIDHEEAHQIQGHLQKYAEKQERYKRDKKKLSIAGIFLAVLIIPVTFAIHYLLKINGILPFGAGPFNNKDPNFILVSAVIIGPCAIWGSLLAKRLKKRTNSLISLFDDSMDFWLDQPDKKEFLSLVEPIKTAGLVRIQESFRVSWKHTSALIAQASKSRVSITTAQIPNRFKILVLRRSQKTSTRILVKRVDPPFSTARMFAKPGYFSSLKEQEIENFPRRTFSRLSDIEFYAGKKDSISETDIKLIKDILTHLSTLKTGSDSTSWHDAELYLNQRSIVVVANCEAGPENYLVEDNRAEYEMVIEKLNEFDAALSLQMLVDEKQEGR